MATKATTLSKDVERVDPLKQGPKPADRVVYEIGVLLDAQDFKDEQLYHRGRLARALDYLNGNGTIAGLFVEWQKALKPGDDPKFPEGREEEILVKPGLAVDRLGRLIEVPAPACIRLNRWFEEKEPDELIKALHGAPFDGIVVDVFIRFFICERGKTPAFAAGPFDAFDAVQPSRLRDFYKLELVLREEANPPLPADHWKGLSAIADINNRRQRLHDLIFDYWREGKEGEKRGWDQDGPAPLVEHVAGQDPTSLFLARVVLPAAAAPAEGARPVRNLQDVRVDNFGRQFVYTPAALARWLGI